MDLRDEGRGGELCEGSLEVGLAGLVGRGGQAGESALADALHDRADRHAVGREGARHPGQDADFVEHGELHLEPGAPLLRGDKAIFKAGQNFANRKFVVYKLEKEQRHFRVGISVSKKLGNAVVRNSIKRKIRHVLIQHRADLTKDDFVVIARKGVETLDYHQVEQNLLHVLKVAKIYQEGFICEKEE